MKILLEFCLLLFALAFQSTDAKNGWSEQEETTEFWNEVARNSLAQVIQRTMNRKPAKNVIIFLGDGMNLATMTAGRILKGQRNGKSGEETVSIMDKFETVGLSKVYAVDKQTPDSASTATAILCGVKTKFKMVGIDGKGTTGNCSSVKGNEVNSVLEVSAQEGKSTGIITTTQVQHASPASAYAHAATRGWMSDSKMDSLSKRQGCKDIALQLLEMGTKLNVILGGGRAYMTRIQDSDVEYPWMRGNRYDNRNLINEWRNKMPNQKSRYVWNRDQFNRVDSNKTDYLLGLFEPEALQYEHERNKVLEPSLSEMTAKAIEVLRKNEKGYFLFVEGGKIDHGHHQTRANVALNEFIAFEKAISTAVDMTSMEDTLIIVTADHGHGFTFGGNADRGNPISGLARNSQNPSKARDGKLYTSIAYANGPGYQGSDWRTVRQSPNSNQLKTLSYLYQTAVPLGSETHSSEDVIILARGPMSHLFSGTFEQNYISHAMRYASCVGANKLLCSEKSTANSGNNEIETVASSPAPPHFNCNSTNSENSNKIDKKTRLQMETLFIEINEKVAEITATMQLLSALKRK